MNIDTEYLKNLNKLIEFLMYTGIDDPYIAGGAIRDMLFEKPISDIDVFYSSGTFNPGSFASNLINLQHFPVSDHNYPDNKFEVTNIIKVNYLPVHIQLIKVQSPLKWIKDFPVEISRFYMNPYGDLCLNADLLLIAEKKQLYSFSSENTEKYNQKIVTKYNDWTYLQV